MRGWVGVGSRASQVLGRPSRATPVQLRSGEWIHQTTHSYLLPLVWSVHCFSAQLSFPLFFFFLSWSLLVSCLSVCREVHTHRAAWPRLTSTSGDGAWQKKKKYCSFLSQILTSHSSCPLCFLWLSDRPHSISGFTHAPPPNLPSSPSSLTSRQVYLRLKGAHVEAYAFSLPVAPIRWEQERGEQIRAR